MAGQDLHQRRFARAVLTDDGMHLAGTQVERNAAQDLDRSKALGQSGRRQNRHGLVAGFDMVVAVLRHTISPRRGFGRWSHCFIFFGMNA